MPDPEEQVKPDDRPDQETRYRTIKGEQTGWEYAFKVPPVHTTYWSTADWDRWITRWFRKEKP